MTPRSPHRQNTASAHTLAMTTATLANYRFVLFEHAASQRAFANSLGL